MKNSRLKLSLFGMLIMLLTSSCKESLQVLSGLLSSTHEESHVENHSVFSGQVYADLLNTRRSGLEIIVSFMEIEEDEENYYQKVSTNAEGYFEVTFRNEDIKSTGETIFYQIIDSNVPLEAPTLSGHFKLEKDETFEGEYIFPEISYLNLSIEIQEVLQHGDFVEISATSIFGKNSEYEFLQEERYDIFQSNTSRLVPVVSDFPVDIKIKKQLDGVVTTFEERLRFEKEEMRDYRVE